MIRSAHRPAQGFLLIELLLSVFILAIGIISVSALFPAGIAQQQQSADDQLGPVVAEQALGLLRNRVRSADFGSFEQFGVTDLLSQSVSSGSYAYRPSPGDWSWIRPAVVRQPQPGLIGLPPQQHAGSLDIFAAVAQRPWPAGTGTGGGAQEFCEFPQGITGTQGIPLYGVPYNYANSFSAPAIFISPQERWWPLRNSATGSQVPQYQWECMFRRTGGRVQVAIFVFRVVGVGGAQKSWSATSAGITGPYDPAIGAGIGPLPPVPYRRVPVSSSASAQVATVGPDVGAQVAPGWRQSTFYLSDLPGNAQYRVLNMTVVGPFTTGSFHLTTGASGQGLLPGDFPANALPQVQSQWQCPGQWIVDNNGNVHRVTVGRRGPFDPMQVRLSAPVPCVPDAQTFEDYELPNQGPAGIRTMHYVPMIIDSSGTQLVPVYVIVRDL